MTPAFPSLNMPAAMHLTVLLSLLAATVCKDITTSSAAIQVKETTTRAAHHTSLAAIENNDSLLSATINNFEQPPTTTTLGIFTAVTSEKVPSSSPPPTSSQTPDTTDKTHPSVTPPQTTTTNQTFNETVSDGSTLPPASVSPNVTATTTLNTTSPGFVDEWGNGSLAESPGLVAILCIFSIIFVLLLVVAIAKCIRSQRSNFERLDEVPMDKVNEGSPFAQYSK